MADPKKRLESNVEGNFFVDSTCINCDTCRQIAPGVFGERGGYSMVAHQPNTARAVRVATQALLCCPTGSIGTLQGNNAKEVIDDFPVPIGDGVHYCGFNSPRSYGGNSYFIRHPDGNWMIDSPKFLPQLVKKFEEMGGISKIFLTHRDDVADAKLYADRFAAHRIIHARDISAMPDTEIVLDGDEDHQLGEDFLVIPTPGHTAGHCVLLYKRQYLFTGDHLAWDRDTEMLDAWRDYCWYDWELQKQSLEKLQQYNFEWILTGHGQSVNLSARVMHEKLSELLESLS